MHAIPSRNTRPFRQVDVFTATAGRGNPLAVVLEGQGLDDDQMQQFARWTQLSETTFVLPPTNPGADYRVRIYTPGGELPFAGHPTLGTCHAWLAAGGQPRDPAQVVQQCGVGLVPVRRTGPDGTRLAFAAPALRREPLAPAALAEILAALQLQPAQVLASQRLDNGPVWNALLLDSVDTVLALAPDHARLRAAGLKVGVAAPAPASPLIARSNREARAFGARPPAAPAAPSASGAEPDLEVRAFAAPVGIAEDPVTGSLNASLAQWLIAEGHLGPRYVAAQGTCLGREGRVWIERDDAGQVWVGGDVQPCIEGTVRL
jgi:PhzF family phenazine biosynthesis protein